jgi:hypothetical protein
MKILLIVLILITYKSTYSQNRDSIRLYKFLEGEKIKSKEDTLFIVSNEGYDFFLFRINKKKPQGFKIKFINDDIFIKKIRIKNKLQENIIRIVRNPNNLYNLSNYECNELVYSFSTANFILSLLGKDINIKLYSHCKWLNDNDNILGKIYYSLFY